MIIGRKQEQKRLEKAYYSNEAEFIVIYGRRRVGKTYLIREFFSARKCKFFQATGLQKGTLKRQLKKFTENLSQTFFDNALLTEATTWNDVFELLPQQIFKLTENYSYFLMNYHGELAPFIFKSSFAISKLNLSIILNYLFL